MKSSRVNEIDLLRFLAVLAVVIFHYAFRGHAANGMSNMPYPLLALPAKYGYLGVELFFMISGFVILMTAANGSLRGFVVSRIARLYPAFWACCTITYIVTLAIGKPRFEATLGQYLVNMTMFSGFVRVPPIDGAYWSLFVEIRFYALVAMILALRQINLAQPILVAWLVASIAMMAVPIGEIEYLLITDYSALFIAGATFYLIWSRGSSWTRWTLIGVSLCLAIYHAVHDLPRLEKQYQTDLNDTIVAVTITVFFTVMSLISLRRTGYIGERRWALVGAVTYPLYLLHQHIGFMFFHRVYPAVNAHLVFWFTVLAAIAAAYAVHVFVERPCSKQLKTALNRFVDSGIRGWQRRSSIDAP